eukprot:Nitzschia sp. Nitz4//scaffold50_size126154//10231//12732//NITZ4_003668-RA/size126154-augustus-gene-0.124-mRNA-1//-1//CDS//3329553647//6629//frame0
MAPSTSDGGASTDNRFTVDIRLFLVMIVSAMALSFGVGVGMGPSAVEMFQASSQQQQLELPPVTSVTVDGALENASVPGVHEPAGQHLLVDIKGIEADFLDSEARLSHAMVETVQQAGLTMLSYHCHKLIPKGVSCVGVLLESHISFHTWPDEGVITLDLFTCGNNPLIPVVATIKELFGIPRANDEIHMQWSHELRGFRNKDPEPKAGTETNYAVLDHNCDLSQMVWSPIDCVVKEQIVSTLTKYQRVDIWDMVGLEETPSHADALKYDLQPGDPRWITSELVAPTRFLFLDGVLQSESFNHAEYHEAMVHPAMFTHANPVNVAVVGGGEGATLREVLKHNSVEKVVMVEIDEELLGIVREHMPYFANCTDFIDRADDCFEDPAADVVIDDAKSWFVQRYAQEGTRDGPAFDVVIVDALEPEMGSPISKGLYDSTEILEALLNSMTDEGIMAIQIGRAPTILDPRPDIGFNAPRERLFQALEKLDQVEAMFVYEDAHCGFAEPRAFMVVCKSSSCRQRFYATADEMDYYIYDRITRTHSKERALKYFDGVTHLSYQVSPKAWETIYCRREPTPFECAYRDMDFKAPLLEFNVENESEGDFTVSVDFTEVDGEKKIEKTHVWANVDIPKGAYIMADHLASSLQLSHPAIDNLRDNLKYGGVTVIEDFVDFIDTYGHESKAAGSARTLVEIGASYFIASVDEEEEANVGRWLPPHPDGKRPKYSPVYERHRLSFDVFMVATKDIPKGTELKRFAKMWDQE